MGKFEEFRNKNGRPLEQNRLLFEWLCDDGKRAEFYGELKKERFPILRFRSLAGASGDGQKALPDVYLVSSRADVAAALQHSSVAPYAALDSGGGFMLGVDDRSAHAAASTSSRNRLAARVRARCGIRRERID